MSGLAPPQPPRHRRGRRTHQSRLTRLALSQTATMLRMKMKISMTQTTQTWTRCTSRSFCTLDDVGCSFRALIPRPHRHRFDSKTEAAEEELEEVEEQIRTTAVCVRLWCSVPPTKWFASRSTRLLLWHSMVEDYRKHMGGLSAILEHDHDIAKLQAIANRRDEDLSRALVREMGNNEDIRKQVDACRREQVRHKQHTNAGQPLCHVYDCSSPLSPVCTPDYCSKGDRVTDLQRQAAASRK